MEEEDHRISEFVVIVVSSPWSCELVVWCKTLGIALADSGARCNMSWLANKNAKFIVRCLLMPSS